VVDHFSQFGIGNTVFDLDSVPMFFVHVIPGPDLFVSIAEVER